MDGVTLPIMEFFGNMILVTELGSSKLCAWLVPVFIDWVFEGSDPDAEALTMEVVAGEAEFANEGIIYGLAAAG